MENLAANAVTHRLRGPEGAGHRRQQDDPPHGRDAAAKEGCEVFTAVDGFDALSKIADHQPDIVFVDIMMPRLDGYQTCSLIKHNKVFRSIPVIMLSSKDGLFDRARGRIVGSEHYLTKPFTQGRAAERDRDARGGWRAKPTVRRHGRQQQCDRSRARRSKVWHSS